VFEDVFHIRSSVVRDIEASSRLVLEGAHASDLSGDILRQEASQNIPDHGDGVKGSVAGNLESNLTFLTSKHGPGTHHFSVVAGK